MSTNKQIASAFMVFCMLIAWSRPVYSQNLIEQLTGKDSVTKARVLIYQDKRIESLVLHKSKNITATEPLETPVPPPKNNTAVNEGSESDNSAAAVEKTIKGYRVQVFSSNEQTAKNEAYQVQEQLLSAFPDMQADVLYTAPNWKVRAGNCRTREEAQELRKTIRGKFPDIKDIYIVPDKVKVRR